MNNIYTLFSAMSKIILIWGILLAVAFAHAHDSWYDDEGSVDDGDSFMSGIEMVSGMEETFGDGHVDEYGEDEIGIGDFDHDSDHDYDDEDDYDDDYDDEEGLEFKTHRRSRRSAKRKLSSSLQSLKRAWLNNKLI